MTSPDPFNISKTFARLRGTAVEPLPAGETFWERLAAGEFGTFHNEFLVTCHTFESDWSSWEMHPHGDEIVCLLSGRVTFVLEQQDGNREIELTESGACVIVPKGTWHTAKTPVPSRMLFITAGEGTQHRPATP